MNLEIRQYERIRGSIWLMQRTLAQVNYRYQALSLIDRLQIQTCAATDAARSFCPFSFAGLTEIQ
jgi:hypothetical protein